MASKLPPRLLSHFSKHARRRPICPNTPKSLLPGLSSAPSRHASTSNLLSDTSLPDPETRDASNSSPAEMEVYGTSRPRWSYTPPLMKAPVPLNRKKPGNEISINKDPAKLDEVYIRMLGRDGDKLLSEEVKWLAVTHKSFDHGRRGFNDRLAYLGRRIVELQTSLALVQSSSESLIPPVNDPHGRTPFHHPSLQGVEALTQKAKDMVTDKKQLSGLATSYGLQGVIRWKPKKAGNLTGSGIESVLTQTVYAIIGAVALERGGEVANRAVRERILHPLGLGGSNV